jgi:hypothetical protein
MSDDKKALELPLLRRREFMYLTSVVALAPGFSGIASAAESLTAAAAAGPRPMSVGFIEGSEAWGEIAKSRSLAGERVVPAKELLLGDQQLALEQLRVTVHGVYPKALADKGMVPASAFTVFFPNPDETLLDGPLPFHAWEYQKRPAPSPAARVSFELPSGTYGDVDFALDVIETQRGRTVKQRYLTRFTVDSTDGMPKLQRGVYLLGFAAATWDSPATLPAAGKKLQPELASLVVAFDLAKTMLR